MSRMCIKIIIRVRYANLSFHSIFLKAIMVWIAKDSKFEFRRAACFKYSETLGSVRQRNSKKSTADKIWLTKFKKIIGMKEKIVEIMGISVSLIEFLLQLQVVFGVFFFFPYHGFYFGQPL